MRTSFAENGYMFLKGLLPREDVLEARRQYFELLSPTGLLKPGSEPVEGVFDADRDRADFPGFGTRGQGTGTATSDQFMDLALKAHSQPRYADFCKHPDMVDFIKKFTGWGENTWPLERTLLRNNIPGNNAIGVHYDYIFLRHGGDSVLTAWVPIGDTDVTGGGLIYLEHGKPSVSELSEPTALTRSEFRSPPG